MQRRLQAATSAIINYAFVLEVHQSESCTYFSHLQGPTSVLLLPLLSHHTSGEWYCTSDPNPETTQPNS